MKLDFREIEDVTIVDMLDEELAHPQWNEFQRAMNRRIEDGARVVLLNMAKMEFMDSFGIGILISIRNKLMKEKGTIALCNLSKRVRMIIDITALHKVLELYETEEEALQSLASKE